MTWVRFEDRTPRDPKVLGLSDAEHRLWFNAVCYCCEHTTDGELPAAALVFCYQASPRKLSALAMRLVVLGLWTAQIEGFHIVNFLKYNPSRAQVETERKRKAEAGRAGAAARWHGDMAPANGTTMTPATAPSGAPSRAVPKPIPLAAAAAREESPDAARASRAWSAQSPGSLNQNIWEALDGWLADGIPIDWIEEACKEAGLNGGRKPVKYVNAILERWRKDGFGNDTRSRNGDTRLPATGAFGGGGRIPNEPGFNAPFVSGLEIERLAGDTERPVGRFRPAADSPFSEDPPGGEAAE